jgi:hypothetical protein
MQSVDKYDDGTNEQDSWISTKTSGKICHEDIRKKRTTVYDLHCFIEQGSSEIPHYYSKMVAAKNGINSDIFEMKFDFDPIVYGDQVAELLQFTIDPQEMLVVEALLALESIGVDFNKDLVEDLFQYSLRHPNAIMCHLCRKINWKHSVKYFYDSGVIECLSCGENRRTHPDTGKLGINFETK